jgi:hypothetical protein
MENFIINNREVILLVGVATPRFKGSSLEAGFMGSMVGWV